MSINEEQASIYGVRAVLLRQATLGNEKAAKQGGHK